MRLLKTLDAYRLSSIKSKEINDGGSSEEDDDFSDSSSDGFKDTSIVHKQHVNH